MSPAQGRAIVWDSCRAHTANIVKEHLNRRGIKNVVIPGGLTPYVQAGDLGIYKSFKDKISPLIAAWKRSRDTPRTPRGVPRPPKLETVVDWVKTAWNEVGSSVVLNSIHGAGFAPETNWHISKHDIYGDAFRNAWLSREMVERENIESMLENDVAEDENVIIHD